MMQLACPEVGKPSMKSMDTICQVPQELGEAKGDPGSELYLVWPGGKLSKQQQKF